MHVQIRAIGIPGAGGGAAGNAARRAAVRAACVRGARARRRLFCALALRRRPHAPSARVRSPLRSFVRSLADAF
jgi:hypothetical protein